MPVPSTPSLTVGHAEDPAEHAADRMAESALSRIQRAPDASKAPSATPAPRPLVGREGGALDAGTDAAIQGMRGGGAPLGGEIKNRMESAFGTDLGGVRVHADNRAADLSGRLSARAFTVGSDVFFGSGQFRPETAAGEHTLAHELAHVVQGGGSARRIHRLYDMQNNQPLGLDQTQSIGTVGDRQVWFFTSKDDHTVVVKLEDQPLGLNQMATYLHANLTKATTVETKKLEPADRGSVKSMIEAGRLTSGPGWAKAYSNDLKKTDYADLDEYGRAVHLAALANKPNDPMIAMSVASGKSIKDLQDPSLSYEQDGVEPIKKVLTEPAMLRQLGELSALDLFIGNRDRVLSGNLGNWFYTPDREMTVIDNVDASMTKYLTDVGDETKAADPLNMLASGSLRNTSAELVEAIVNVVKNNERMMKTMTYKSTGGTYQMADKDKQQIWLAWVAQHRSVMEKEMLAGLKLGRKRIVKTMSSSRFTNRGKRSTKKAIKAEAAAAMQQDAGHNQVDYYDLLKSRAKWLDKH